MPLAGMIYAQLTAGDTAVLADTPRTRRRADRADWRTRRFSHSQLRPAAGQFRTAICWKSPSPKFNEEFCFRCRRSELPRHTLDLRVYDKDISKSNDFIGTAC